MKFDKLTEAYLKVIEDYSAAAAPGGDESNSKFSEDPGFSTYNELTPAVDQLIARVVKSPSDPAVLDELVNIAAKLQPNWLRLLFSRLQTSLGEEAFIHLLVNLIHNPSYAKRFAQPYATLIAYLTSK